MKLRNMEWVLARMKAGKLPIYTADLETDPFLKGQVPKPFVCGFFDGLQFRYFWVSKLKDCIQQFREFLESGLIEPGIIYLHNGGRFDFFYMLDFFEGRAMVIGSRIVRAFMPLPSPSNNRGPQRKRERSRSEKQHRFEFRDSYAIMPFPLKAYKKDDLPLEYLKAYQREQHRSEILSYLEGDCTYLWELCMQFQEEFGDYKTIASAAFDQLSNFHKYETLPKAHDTEIRKDFYFGGRVQCFEKGVITQPVTIYDVNSMYPFVMDTYFHPVSWITSRDNQIHGWDLQTGQFTDEKLKTFFITVEGEAFAPGPFAIRKPNGSVDFEAGYGTFHTTIHEYLAAIQLGLFKPKRIVRSFNFGEYSRFHLFVDHFNRAKEKAQESGDKVHRLFYKYILNSAYGKFGLNPENYHNWEITKDATPPKGTLWTLDTIVQDGKYYVWKQPNMLSWNVKNIGTAASITGAARSVLLRSIAHSKNVLYCDTDSILCKEFGGGQVDEKKLGAWKPEGYGTVAAIAGKKMYAVFAPGDGKPDTDIASFVCVKSANKGVNLKPSEILRLAQGEEILCFRDAPTFKRDGSATFIERTVRMT